MMTPTCTTRDFVCPFPSAVFCRGLVRHLVSQRVLSQRQLGEVDRSCRCGTEGVPKRRINEGKAVLSIPLSPAPPPRCFAATQLTPAGGRAHAKENPRLATVSHRREMRHRLRGRWLPDRRSGAGRRKRRGADSFRPAEHKGPAATGLRLRRFPWFSCLAGCFGPFSVIGG